MLMVIWSILKRVFSAFLILGEWHSALQNSHVYMIAGYMNLGRSATDATSEPPWRPVKTGAVNTGDSDIRPGPEEIETALEAAAQFVQAIETFVSAATSWCGTRQISTEYHAR
jgi:hypothetical protein